jgi:nitrogen fixation protein FixH
MARATTVRDQPDKAAKKSGWNFFPFAVILALTFVAGVNAVMVTQALGTFPGEAGIENGYDLSNSYNKIIDAAQAQAALGWKLVVFGRDQHLVARLTDRNGHALGGLTLTATATRPVGPLSTTKLVLEPDGDGHWVSTESLDLGQWLVDVTAKAPGRRFIVTRRVIIR